jgi:predicted  nucleic acid-binding Zn-ribbon protein
MDTPGSYGKTCTRCGTFYSEASARFLYSDETGGYCPCGGRLLESVEPEGERHYRLLIPEPLKGSRRTGSLRAEADPTSPLR